MPTLNAHSPMSLRRGMLLGCLGGLLCLGPVQAQSVPETGWSVTVDPASAQAPNAHWTFTLSAQYCGGLRIGDGVHIRPEEPLALSDTISADGVAFANGPAQVSSQDGTLQVGPAPGLAYSQVCIQGDRPFTVELMPSLGLSNPDPGSYVVDVWLGADGTPVQLPLTIEAQPDSPATGGE